MEIIKSIKDMQAISGQLKAEGRTIGFVPTMGALHEGHVSLVRRAGEENDRTVASIFVNPVQFGPGEDYSRYPRDTEGDLKKLSALDVDIVFLPDKDEMYPEGFSLSVNIGSLGLILCGVSRPGHFNGVATVVSKLFNIVMPDRAYFGQKDFQQTVVIKKVVKELNFDIDIVVCPTVREPDGLAMSSRNTYLNKEERKASCILYKALKLGEELIRSGNLDDTSTVKKEMGKLIGTEPLAKLDCIEIVDPYNLDPIDRVIFAAIIHVAVHIGNTRLIDNIIAEKS